MKSKLIYLLLAGMLCTTSCQDILEENPDSYYQRKDFFVNASNAELAVMGIYNVLPTIYGDKDGMSLPCSDDTYYVNGTTSDPRRDIAHYVLKPSNTWVYNVWKGKYEGVNRANYAIDGIEGMKGFRNDDNLKKLVGEARFLRAQATFDLVRYWGDVPFKTVYSDGYEMSYLPRTDREDIYEQIIEDLEYAKSNFCLLYTSPSPRDCS